MTLSDLGGHFGDLLTAVTVCAQLTRDLLAIAKFLVIMAVVDCWNSAALTSPYDRCSWLAAATWTTAREPNVPLQDLTP